MAEGENKLDGKRGSCDRTDEPVDKKSRSSVLLSCRPTIHEKQRTYEAESNESYSVAVLARPENAEREIPADHSTLRSQEGNNELATSETTEHTLTREQTLLSAPEIGVSGITSDVHHNGLYSSDPNDDECSSHASSSDWTPQPRIGSYHFIQEHIVRETDPRIILKDLLPETSLPPDLDDLTLWQIIINISEPPKRMKRKDINTLDDIVRLLNECKKILVLTGAGVSVSCGIPDFRSRDGIYARLAVDFPDLPDPQAMFDIEYFRRDPRPFFKFAKEIYPGQFRPSLCHRFIAMLDKQGKILRNYTQNIDTLEQVAGVQRVIQCHGSFATASCLVCKLKVDCEALREDIFKQVVPHCPRCPEIPFAIMKPDIVFFGENLPDVFHRAMKQDKDEVDLLIVIGSSLKVRPVALIPSSIPHGVPQVLINREPLPHLNFDVELLGDCDVIVNELCHRLGGDFNQLCCNSYRLSEITEKPPPLIPTLPEVETYKVQETAVTGHNNIIPDATETVTVINSYPSAHFVNEEDVDMSSCVSRETKPDDLGSISDISVKPLTDSTLFPEPPEQAVRRHPKPQYEKEMIIERQTAEDPKSRCRTIEVRKQSWMGKTCKSPISEHLGAFQYLFKFPNRYIFYGAEVYSGDETSRSSDSDGSCSIGNGLEEEESNATEYCAEGEGSVRASGCSTKSISSIQTDNIMDKLHTAKDL